MSNATMGSRVGSMVGHYRLRRRLGAGRFGEVYEAEDTEYQRIVALKLIAPSYLHSSVFQERFFREVQQIERLHDPHVAPMHTWGEIDGQLYIDMHLIDGHDLGTLLSRYGPLSPPRAVAIVGQIASALDHAHAHEVIHSDVKPANILITRYGFACLVDFGLANAATEAGLTRTGTGIGTLAYMAPEQFRPTEVTNRADVYALACVLFECLTGSQPYTADDRIELIEAHMKSPPPRPSQVRSNIPRAFDEVIARGMAKEHTRRYASAGYLALAAYHALAARDQYQADTIMRGGPAATPADSLGYVDPTLGAGQPIPPSTAMPAAPVHSFFPPPADADTVVPAATVHTPRHATESIARSPAPAENRSATQQPAIETVRVPPPTAWMPSPTPEQVPSAEPPRRRRIGRRTLIALIATAVLVIASVASLVAFLAFGSFGSSPGPGPSSTSALALPFIGLRGPENVAVDRAGNIFVTDHLNSRVLELPAGSHTQTELPFTGLRGPGGVAVDAADTIFVTDYLNNRVLKLPAGSHTQTELPFIGLHEPRDVGVDTLGNVYVTDNLSRVLKLSVASQTQTELPFTGLIMPDDLAVDAAGNIYVADYGNNRVLKLPAGSHTQAELPYKGLNEPVGVAVDTAGNAYVTDCFNNQVLKLPPGSDTQVVLPLTGIRDATGMTVDSNGNVYVADYENDRVLKLPAS
jgi:serine/threonine protein kinase, bacterial